MANIIEADVIQKIATEEQWLTQTRIPYQGQIMLVGDSSGKVTNIKVGDGVNPFSDLNYMFDSIQQNAQYVPITSNALPTPVADPAWGMVTDGTYTFGGVDVFTVPDGHWGIANYSSGAWSLVDMGELPQVDTSDFATKDMILEHHVVTEEEQTEMYPNGSPQFYNTHIRITDVNMEWQQGDRLKTLILPIAGSTPSLQTTLYIYDSEGNVDRQYNVGVPSEGNNTIDLYGLNIILQSGEHVSIQCLSYNSSVTTTNRFYNELTSSYVTSAYYFQFVFDRIVSDEEVNRIDVLEENINEPVNIGLSADQSDGKLQIIVNSKNLKQGSTSSNAIDIPNATENFDGSMSRGDKRNLDTIHDQLFVTEIVDIDTPIYPHSGDIFINPYRRIVDKSINWQDGDILESVTIPIGSTLPTQATVLYIYDINNNVKSTHDLGTLSSGSNTIDLTGLDITLMSGDYPALSVLGYYNGITIPSDRFYDVSSSTYLSFPYFFSYRFKREINEDVITKMESDIEYLKNNTPYQTKGKTIVIFGDSAVAASDWAQNLIEDLEFSEDSKVYAIGGYTYATQINEDDNMVSCLRLLIEQFELQNPELVPDIFLFQIGGNDYWLYQADNERLGSVEGAFTNRNYLAIDDTIIYNGIRRNLEYIKRKYPTSTMLVGTPFQSRLHSRKVIADAVDEVCDVLSIQTFDGNSESGISQYLECIPPVYTDNPLGGASQTYPNYNWVEPNGEVVSVENKSEDAIKRYGLYTYDGTHQNIERGRQRILQYMKSVVLSNYTS